MSMPGEISAREDGLPVAEGDVRLSTFPQVADTSGGLDLSEMHELVRNIRPAELALNRRYVSHVPDGAAFEIVEIEAHSRTRTASRHEVLFGQLLVQGEVGELAAQVAVKTLPDEVVAHEYGVSDYLHSGNVPDCDTFPPLGIMRGFDGQAALITEYKQSVKSNDIILWHPELIHDRLTVDSVLGKAAVALATLHSNGWVHGDPSVKNSVVNMLKSRRGQTPDHEKEIFFYNDLEDAGPISHLSAEQQRAKKMLDVDVFVWSAFRLKRQGYDMPEDYTEQLREHFGLVYAGAQNGGKGHDSALSMEEISNIIDLEEANTKNGFPVLDPKRPADS